MSKFQYRIEKKIGREIENFIPEIARLRIHVFREFPYLYDGSLEYETKYLQTYLDNPHSFVALAIIEESNGTERIIGASTGIPLNDEIEEIRDTFISHGLSLEEFFYFGESVLELPYRGKGIGKAFFQAREEYARGLGFQKTCFCAVIRPTHHPLRPKDYRPLDPFWTKLGYKRHPELTTKFSWKDIDKETEDKKELVFWIKEGD